MDSSQQPHERVCMSVCEYYLFLKRKKFLSFVTTVIGLKLIMLSEISQALNTNTVEETRLKPFKPTPHFVRI